MSYAGGHKHDLTEYRTLVQRMFYTVFQLDRVWSVEHDWGETKCVVDLGQPLRACVREVAELGK